MRYKSILSIFFILTTYFSFSQEKYIALTIKPELKTKSNAVVRSSKTEIIIESKSRLITKKHRIVTVFNEAGQSKVRSSVFYDNAIKVKNLEAKIYNALGQEIKKIKKKDFKDVSYVDGFSIFTDNRIKYLDYTPTNYPYTVEFSVETVSDNTAYIQSWSPIEGYYVSTEFSSFKVINNSGETLARKIKNFENYKGLKEVSKYSFTATNLPALPAEAYTPALKSFTPNVKVALQNFSMSGVSGINSSWKDFGKWMNDKLISGTEDLPEEVKQKVLALTKNASTPLEKAKIIYKYVQDKSRYVSIQVGIGSWKPMLASDVDRLGYGDCKGLTNYTKALLKIVGVESFYTIVYGNKDIESLDSKFSSLEGNHVILTIPHEENYIWLECTSQDAPFGYNANFTDDRDVLILTPNGGEIVHTKTYKTSNNTQVTKAKVNIFDNGDIDAAVYIEYKGIQYDKHTHLESQNLKDQKMFYKNNYDNINNLNVESIAIVNDKENIVFTEDLKLTAKSYATKAGNRFLVTPNMFNKMSFAPPRYNTRKLPFEIDRGYKYIDEYVINLSQNFSFESLKETVDISNKFGTYKVSIKKKNDSSITYKREFIINKGSYSKKDYSIFRKFLLEIVKHDKSKISIIKN